MAEFFHLAGALMEHVLEGIAPLRHCYINPKGALPLRKCSIKPPTKCKTTIYVLKEICLQ